MKTRVLIVDDNAHFLQAARALLEREGMSVVGVATTYAEAVRGADELRPDVTLVDIDLGDDSGFEVARQLAGPPAAEPSSVILISAYPLEDFQDLVESSSAIGFLSKSDLSREAISILLQPQTTDGADSSNGRRGM
jgi:DNA-binding NarL/FixJ family response regulator